MNFDHPQMVGLFYWVYHIIPMITTISHYILAYCYIYIYVDIDGGYPLVN